MTTKKLNQIKLTKPTRKNEAEYLMYNAKDTLDQTIQVWRYNIQTLAYSMSHEYNYYYDNLKESIKLNYTLKEIKHRFNLLEWHINEIIKDYNYTIVHGLKEYKTIQQVYNETKKAYLEADTNDIEYLQRLQKELKKLEDQAIKNKIEIDFFEPVTA